MSKGWLKASHREKDEKRSKPERPFYTHTNPQPLKPGEVYEFDIEVLPISYVFKKGHRLRLELANGNSPATDGVFSHPYHPTQMGTDTIHHDARTRRASCCRWSVAKENTMTLPRRRLLQTAAAGLALPALPRIARAQSYPSRPITMIVPYAAGGPTDTVGRVVAERMRAELGQPIVLENVGGAGGSIGLGRVARAAPDGYTINVGNWSAHVINGAIYSLPYDLKTDFEPIALLAQAPQMVVARKATPADDLKGLIAWLKANPDKTTAGTAGIGSPPHIGGVLFQSMTGTDRSSCTIAACRWRRRTLSRARST